MTFNSFSLKNLQKIKALMHVLDEMRKNFKKCLIPALF